MTKTIDGDLYSDLITSADPRPMNGDDNRGVINKIIIHHNATTNYQQAIQTWLAGSPANTSAHYEITPDQIIGCVGENRVAYQAGNYQVNQTSIGLEHVDATGAPDWTVAEATLQNSAKLIADICKRYGFEPNANTIVPHSSITATACPGGLDVGHLIDLARGIYYGQAAAPVNAVNYNQLFRNGNNRFFIGSAFKILDRQTFDGIDQVHLQGITLEPFDWFNNGIPLNLLIDLTSQNFQIGDMVKFAPGYNSGTIDNYSDALQGCQINFGDGANIWFDSKALWES